MYCVFFEREHCYYYSLYKLECLIGISITEKHRTSIHKGTIMLCVFKVVIQLLTHRSFYLASWMNGKTFSSRGVNKVDLFLLVRRLYNKQSLLVFNLISHSFAGLSQEHFKTWGEIPYLCLGYCNDLWVEFCIQRLMEKPSVYYALCLTSGFSIKQKKEKREWVDKMHTKESGLCKIPLKLLPLTRVSKLMPV